MIKHLVIGLAAAVIFASAVRAEEAHHDKKSAAGATQS